MQGLFGGQVIPQVYCCQIVLLELFSQPTPPSSYDKYFVITFVYTVCSV